MRIFYRFLTALLLTTSAQAHQFTPTYPQFEISFVEGVLQTSMQLFNKRSEVQYYELGVFDKDWKSVTFAASVPRIVNVEYLETKNINIFVKAQDAKNVVYICTESKLLRTTINNTLVASKICSKVRQ